MAPTKWQQALHDHRCVIVHVDGNDWAKHVDLVQKFLSQVLVIEARADYAHRCQNFTVISPDLPASPNGHLVMEFWLEIDLTTRTPSAYLGSDQLLKVSL